MSGCQSGTFNPISELLVVRASDPHTLVEAWLPGRGWTTFDPTPPDPDRQRLSLWSKLALYTDAAETFWHDWVLSYDLGRQLLLADRMERSSRRLGLEWFGALTDSSTQWKPHIAAVAGLVPCAESGTSTLRRFTSPRDWW